MNILLTSVGRRSYMISYFKEALEGEGLVYVANNIETYAMNLADQKVITPMIYDESYISFLLSYCKEKKIDVIISLFDIDLPILAKNKKVFADQGITVVISSYEVTQICNDKWLTFNFLNNHQIATPKTFLTIGDCVDAIKQKEIAFPLMIKPRWGMGSIGVFEVCNLNELNVLYQKTKDQIFDSYLKYESSVDIERSIIIQEKLSGNEYGLDVFNDLDGEFLTCIPKVKLSMRAGETDIAEIIDDEALYQLGKQIASELKHIANLDVDCFKKNDIFYVLELNCRFGGQYPFSHLAGANFPKAIIQLLKNESVDQKNLHVFSGTRGYKDITPTK